MSQVSMPFTFVYFGYAFSKVWVASNGVCTFHENFGVSSASNMTLGGGAGKVAVLWDDLNPVDTGRVVTWTAGIAPNRRFIVSWEGVSVGAQQHVGSLTFQAQYYEGSNRIVFAYKPDTDPSTWIGLSYSMGIETYAAGVWVPGNYGDNWDRRYVEPLGRRSDFSGHPGTDIQFDTVDFVSVTGTLLYDRVSADANGLGNSVQVDAPLPSVCIVARQADGLEIARATTAEDGRFDLRLPGPPIKQPFVYAVAENDACVVRTASTSPPTDRLLFYQSYMHVDTDVGGQRVSQAVDSSGVIRASLSIASKMLPAWAFVTEWAATPVSRIEVVYDMASTAQTVYSPAGGSVAASLRVGSAASSNDDAWDPGVIVRTWGRHVAAEIAAPQTSGWSATFDGETDVQSAFLHGFGCYLYAASYGTSTIIDAVSTTQATVIDLEDPQPSTAKGPRVAAWVAAALYDTIDADNESHDRMDGRTHAERALLCVESLATPPEAVSFYDAWAQFGADELALSRNFIAHGLIADDAWEMNDDASEATPIGAAPQLRQGGSLSPYNEDWFEFTLPAGVPQLRADVWFRRDGSDTPIALELRSAAGALVATGSAQPVPGPWRVVAAPLVAGTYRVRVRAASGARIDGYTLQVYEPLAITNHGPLAWTVGQPFSRSIGAHGGVPPWTLNADPPAAKPPGIGFLAGGDRVVGLPTTAGAFQMVLKLEDSGDPAHIATSAQPFIINPPISVELGEFVGFAVDRPSEILRTNPGGTAPLEFSVTDGALPDGISLESTTLRLSGSPVAPGSTRVHIRGSDVAGSADVRDVTVVACVPLGAKSVDAELAEGAAACGFWVDALAGGTVKASVATAPKHAKRNLRAVWIGPDGRIVDAPKLAGGKGRAKAVGLPCPLSGRYYLVLAATEGPATVLRASGADALPSRAGGRIDAFASASPHTFEVGAIAGAKFDLTLTPDTKSKLRVIFAFFVSPGGTSFLLDGVETDKKGVVRFAATLPETGTWKATVVASPQTDGRLSWSMKVRQPKGAEFSAD